MKATKKTNNTIIISLLLILCIASVGFAVRYYHAFQSIDENHVKNQETINSLQARMDSVLLKSKADELFINGHYDSAMLVYRRIPNAKNSSLIDEREKTMVQMKANRRSLQLQAQKALNLAELNQNLLGLNMASVKLKHENINDSMQTVYNNKVEALENQLIHKEQELAESPKMDRLTFRNDKGTKIDYFGEVKNGKANGQGIGNHETGNVYDGEWENNQKHGKGTFRWVEGEVYEGEFVHGKREGKGTYYWPNGDKYVGEWEDDTRNGHGVLYDKDGKIIFEGNWDKDELVKANK